MREAEQAGVEAAEALEPERGLVAALDPMAFGGALLRAAAGVARNPVGLAAALGRLSSGLVQTAAATTARTFGADSTGPLAPDGGPPLPGRRRERQPAVLRVLQSYLVWARYVDDLIGAAGLDGRTEQKARFAARRSSTRWRRRTSCSATRPRCSGRTRPAA